MVSEGPNTVLNLQELGAESLNARLRELRDDSGSYVIEGVEGQDLVGVGLISPVRVRVSGSLGDFCFGGLQQAEVLIDGDVDAACGHSINSGKIHVKGSVGASFGAFGLAGLLVSEGVAGPRCAVGLNGADVMVLNNVGPFAAYQMRKGTLVIVGDAAPNLGSMMTGGVIYVRGNVEHMASGMIEERMKEPDRLRLGLMLMSAGVKLNAKEFRKYMPEQAL